MKKFIFAAIAAFAVAGVANAGGFYGTVNGSVTDYNEDDVDNTYGGGVGVGYNLTDWVAAEVTYDYLGKESIGGTDVTTTSYGVWGVVSPTVATVGGVDVKALARVGYVNTEVDPDGFDSVDDNALAYGAGLGFGVSENLDIVAEWRRRSIDGDQIGAGADDADFDTYSLGLKYNF